MNTDPLYDHALQIWDAALVAVDSATLVRQAIHIDKQHVHVGSTTVDLNAVERIIVVGAGKAAAAMARGVIQAFKNSPLQARITGWVNVPEDCLAKLPQIITHPARPAHCNEPTVEGLYGTQQILDLITSANPQDLCICLISGGGSALLPAPITGITLDDKQQITQLLSSHGANIQQLNSVRKKLSDVKGGRLAVRCTSRHFASLIISDVLGDPLDLIASGPTVVDTEPIDVAIDVLRHFLDDQKPVVQRCLAAIKNHVPLSTLPSAYSVDVIGNNRTAVDAAAQAATNMGYETTQTANVKLEGLAEHVGFELAECSSKMTSAGGKRAYISGGEPVVQLADASIRGHGGRNQQLVLAALARKLANTTAPQQCMQRQFIMSAGTDGEDGPTNAAGAFINSNVVEQFLTSSLDLKSTMQRNDAYTFFDELQALIKTGPTHTNVCDLRIVLSE
jgi:hydroxypyruvate reductase